MLDLVTFSHLRWNFVFQRPQHLLSRAAATQRVFFFEEPIFGDADPHLRVTREDHGPFVAVPHLRHGMSEMEQLTAQRAMVDQLMDSYGIDRYVAWYYTPMMLKFTRHLSPAVTVYDCMDMLSHFLDAPKEITLLEQELFTRVDVAFTGGHSLYRAKRDMHPNVHAFPSSIEVRHFAKARAGLADPADQAKISHPRLGYIGVIDERIDLPLIAGVAARRPDWQIVMIGPVVKIDPATLPQAPNIHYLGGKAYADLPAYLSGWDVAMLPFARNDATRYISPTKTPEYLAAGRRVVSTSITDVVSPYGDKGYVAIADEPDEFVARVEAVLSPKAGPGREAWLAEVDAFLAHTSWDETYATMRALVEDAYESRHSKSKIRKAPPTDVARRVATARAGHAASAPL